MILTVHNNNFVFHWSIIRKFYAKDKHKVFY